VEFKWRKDKGESRRRRGVVLDFKKQNRKKQKK
jgi:hypothetical protein